jgi:hypothetical protein
MLLGTTTPQLTYDLLHKIHKYRYPLPRLIYNLRLTDVVTMAADPLHQEGIATKWLTSGLWLGVEIYGTGDFRT